MERTGPMMNSSIKIFLIRHASPNWDLKSIPYDIHPGPPLSARGEIEAGQAATFLQAHNVVKLYYSPFERSARTAQIIAAHNQIPAVEEKRLSEWRQADEIGEKVRERMSAVFGEIVKESAGVGPIGLVSHGGPINFLLLALGFDEQRLAEFRKKFDGFNPLPPAGIWVARAEPDANSWELNLVFVPPTDGDIV